MDDKRMTKVHWYTKYTCTHKVHQDYVLWSIALVIMIIQFICC